jgi:hypothetical protein
MSKLIRTATFVCVLFACGGLVHAQGWRGIVPLHSNRQDVERVVGVPPESNGITYILKDERVNVVYAKGKCGRGQGVEWNVPPDTVLGLTIYPQVKLLLSNVRADLDGFEKFVHPHDPDVVYYNNEREGVSYGTRSGGEVFVIEYFPTAADTPLRCLRSSGARSDFAGDIELGRKFDEYSKIPFADEKARIDNLALALRQESAADAYIVSYADRHTSVGKAQSRARRAKNYLISVHKIEKERVMTKFGGHREKAGMELYITVRGTSGVLHNPE